MPPRTFISSRFATPADYILARDYCSYGYFLLAPNDWDPSTAAFRRVLSLASGAVTVRVSQPGANANIETGAPLEIYAEKKLNRDEWTQVHASLVRMLRLDEDAAVIGSFHKLDPRWAVKSRSSRSFNLKRSKSGPGRGRLMRSPTFFEDVIKTVTSCNVTWPSTVNMNRRLCEALGERTPTGGYAFPTAEKLARVNPATLRARCGVGYRDQRIVDLAKLFRTPASRGGIDPAWYENPATPDDEIYNALVELPGIGPYAAANIMQLLGRYARLPLDTESIRHAKNVLGMTGSDRDLMKRLQAHYAPFGPHAFRSYWFELWTFYESRQGPAWTWERETTAKAFTAAALKKVPMVDLS